MQQRVLAWPRSVKRLVVIALDVALALLATWLAFSLRFEEWHRPAGAQWWAYVLAPALAVPIFARHGLYRAIFRYSGQAAFRATTRAAAWYALTLTVVLLVWRLPLVPRSLGVLQPLIFLVLIALSRSWARFWLVEMGHSSALQSGRLLIYGAGAAGAQTAVAMVYSRQYALLGFVDDDPQKIGGSLNGIPIYSPGAIPELIARQGVTDILLAMPSAPRQRRSQILRDLQPLPVRVRSLPGLADLASGRVTFQDFAELDLDDLLGRDPVPPDAALLARDLSGHAVLVTGAGGSIGSELVRQILLQNPSRLVLVDHSEYALYTIHQEVLGLCRARHAAVEVVAVLASVTQAARMQQVMAQQRPHTVYHAAAYKHVPMVEHNPGDGVFNNVWGTLYAAQAAAAAGVRRFVLVSTDKAVRPTNVMGASKRVAELVLQALAAQGGPTTFCMVRFGNVLGSSGSVVPLFRRQLAAGGPLTVTHPEVTRYFMTIPEAAQLVLAAGAMGAGGEVFLLDMGEPVRIMDLARRMIELSGLTVGRPDRPQGDVDIQITGLRPGEKLYEELLIGDNPQPTAHPRIWRAQEEGLTWAALEPSLQQLGEAVQAADGAAIRAVLARVVQDYSGQQAPEGEVAATGV